MYCRIVAVWMSIQIVQFKVATCCISFGHKEKCVREGWCVTALSFCCIKINKTVHIDIEKGILDCSTLERRSLSCGLPLSEKGCFL